MRQFSTIALAALLCSAVIGCAAGAAMTGIEPAAGETPLMTVAAHGVQVYECRAAAGAAPAWAFVAPDADLFAPDGRRIGHHGAGPVWTHVDGSGFAGTLRGRVEAPQAGAIPWLLLVAKPQGPAGTFGRVSSVQRIHTVGGQAPASGCSPATLGARVQMAYRADYVLHVPRT